MCEPIYADVVCDSIGHAVLELQKLVQNGRTLVVHMTWSNHGKPAIEYCSEDHEHVVMELRYKATKKEGAEVFAIRPSVALIVAILDERERSVLNEMQKPLDCRMNSRSGRTETLFTKIEGVHLHVTQWAESSNFNGGYDVGGTEYLLLVN